MLKSHASHANNIVSVAFSGCLLEETRNCRRMKQFKEETTNYTNLRIIMKYIRYMYNTGGRIIKQGCPFKLRYTTNINTNCSCKMV